MSILEKFKNYMRGGNIHNFELSEKEKKVEADPLILDNLLKGLQNNIKSGHEYKNKELWKDLEKKLNDNNGWDGIDLSSYSYARDDLNFRSISERLVSYYYKNIDKSSNRDHESNCAILFPQLLDLGFHKIEAFQFISSKYYEGKKFLFDPIDQNLQKILNNISEIWQAKAEKDKMQIEPLEGETPIGMSKKLKIL